MPAKKDSSLSNRHDTKADRVARESAEAAMLPTTQITVKPPAALKGHAHASATWKRILSLFNETKGTIVTAFDQDLLIKYCLAEEELNELAGLRRVVFKLWNTHLKFLEKMKPTGDGLKDYFNALGQANALLQRFQGVDARLDGKRKMVYEMAKSLYLTPRSRTGVAPAEKEAEEPQDEMDQLLDGKKPAKGRKK